MELINYQEVKNNSGKFPKGYVFELDKQEKEEVIKIFDNLGADNTTPKQQKTKRL